MSEVRGTVGSLRLLRGAGVRAEPYCDACGDAVDLSDPDHHVCVPDAAGTLQKSTVQGALRASEPVK